MRPGKSQGGSTGPIGPDHAFKEKGKLYCSMCSLEKENLFEAMKLRLQSEADPSSWTQEGGKKSARGSSAAGDTTIDHCQAKREGVARERDRRNKKKRNSRS